MTIRISHSCSLSGRFQWFSTTQSPVASLGVGLAWVLESYGIETVLPLGPSLYSGRMYTANWLLVQKWGECNLTPGSVAAGRGVGAVVGALCHLANTCSKAVRRTPSSESFALSSARRQIPRGVQTRVGVVRWNRCSRGPSQQVGTMHVRARAAFSAELLTIITWLLMRRALCDLWNFA